MSANEADETPKGADVDGLVRERPVCEYCRKPMIHVCNDESYVWLECISQDCIALGSRMFFDAD